MQEKQEAMARAVLERGLRRLEAPVAHLVTRSATPDARVGRFTAVFEVDASTRPPRIRSGFELELLVPRSPHLLEIELVNGETGVVNIVQIAPEGAL